MPIEINTKEAGRRLGISPQRVIQLIAEHCPQCQGAGCERCRHTGRRLPARKTCCGEKSPYKIRVEDLALVQERKVGRPKK
jgi:hypothetical protein